MDDLCAQFEETFIVEYPFEQGPAPCQDNANLPHRLIVIQTLTSFACSSFRDAGDTDLSPGMAFARQSASRSFSEWPNIQTKVRCDFQEPVMNDNVFYRA